MSLRPVFVGGAGRCGATTLTSMLACSPMVARFEREARFYVDPRGLLDLADCMTFDWDVAHGSAAIKDWANFLRWLAYGQREVASKPFRRWTALYKASRAMIAKLYWAKTATAGRRGTAALYETEPLSEDTMRAHLQSFLATAYTPIRPKASICMDDTSHSVLAVRRLKHWFPTCAVVWVMRDPYDIALCQHESRWGAATLDNTAKRVHHVMSRALHLKGHFDAVVRFEELVARPQRIVPAVASKLGIKGAAHRPLDVKHVAMYKRVDRKKKRVLQRQLGVLRKKLGYR